MFGFYFQCDSKPLPGLTQMGDIGCFPSQGHYSAGVMIKGSEGVEGRQVGRRLSRGRCSSLGQSGWQWRGR